ASTAAASHAARHSPPLAPGCLPRRTSWRKCSRAWVSMVMGSHSLNGPPTAARRPEPVMPRRSGVRLGVVPGNQIDALTRGHVENVVTMVAVVPVGVVAGNIADQCRNRLVRVAQVVVDIDRANDFPLPSGPLSNHDLVHCLISRLAR